MLQYTIYYIRYSLVFSPPCCCVAWMRFKKKRCLSPLSRSPGSDSLSSSSGLLGVGNALEELEDALTRLSVVAESVACSLGCSKRLSTNMSTGKKLDALTSSRSICLAAGEP